MKGVKSNRKKLRTSGSSTKGSKKKDPQEDIPKEVRTHFKGPMVTSNNYNSFVNLDDLDTNLTPKELKEELELRRKIANKTRSLANKYLKAYLRGKTQIRQGTIHLDGGLKVPNTLKISSNEFGIHQKKGE